METVPGPRPRRGVAVKAGVCVAVVLVAGTLAVIKFARPGGPAGAGASSQSTDGRGPRSLPRDPQGAPTTQEVRDATAARDTLRSYFARLATWKMKPAIDLCHTTNGDEQLLATGLAEYVTVQYACREQVKQRFGPAEARQAFGNVFTASDFKTAKAFVKGDRAEVVFDDGQHWPMLKVAGQWRLSIFDYAVSQRRPPAALAAAYTEAVRVHMAVGRELREGKFKSVEGFSAALREGIANAAKPTTRAIEESAGKPAR